MRKTDKKLDNQLRELLTEVCEVALKDIEGFQWLTHVVDFNRFPESLRIICVFDSNAHLEAYALSSENKSLLALIESKMSAAGIKLKNIQKCISYDTEENCDIQHNGNWAKRLA